MSELYDLLEQYVNLVYDIGYIPDKKPILTSPTNVTVKIGEEEIINFASNNYLSLANDPAVKKASIEAIEKYGLGSGASRWMSGTTLMHSELEKKIAKFKNCEDAVIFSSGMLANLGAIYQMMRPALLSVLAAKRKNVFKHKKRAVFFDRANHASLYDACKLAEDKDVKVYYYNRCDVDMLKMWLDRSDEPCKLIVTDGIFSDYGDLAPLDKIYPLAKEYGAMLLVDDAHATGVIGPEGRGTFEYFDMEDALKDHDVVVTGTFSKAVGAEGGFVAGSKEIVKLLRNCRQYIFNTAMSPAVAAGAIKAIDMMEKEPHRRKRLEELSDYLRKRLDENGFEHYNSKTHIIPILIGEENHAEEVSAKLLEEKVYVPCFKYPAVPIGKAIFRASIMYEHTKEQIDFLIERLCHYSDR